MSNIADAQFQERRLVAVQPREDGSFEVRDEEGWILGVRNPANLTPPAAGELARYYGRGIGYTVRGFAVGDLVYYYETVAEERERHEQENRERSELKARQWYDGLSETLVKVASLPVTLRDRMLRFMSREGWGGEFGFYELSACETAARVASHCGTVEALRAFSEKSYEEQNLELPGIGDDHSGNSWGASLMLARTLIEEPDLVPKVHGALCPLVGCEAYGCWSVTQEAPRS